VVEDEAAGRDLLAKGLRRLGFEVVTAADGLEAIEKLDQEFEFIVTDPVMPRAGGTVLLEELNRRSDPAQRIVVTSFADKDRVVAVLNLGADFLLEKPFGVETLGSLLTRLRNEKESSTTNIAQFLQRRLHGLPITPRERQVVELVLRGESNKQIARTLGISEQTVKNTLYGVYQSLNVQSRGELFHVVFPI
jgi:two-component system NarL family response regulator